jgi:DNA polymerase III alpha subunit
LINAFIGASASQAGHLFNDKRRRALRIRSGYSFRTAYGFLEDVMSRIDTEYAPLTDRASAYGFNRWRKLCVKKGRKPVFGVEIAVTDSPNAKKMNLNHVTLIATNSLGPLNSAIELAFSKFRFEPVLTYNDLNAIDPSIKVILGRRIDPQMLDNQREWYVAEGPSQIPAMKRMATEYGWKPIASSDNLYPSPEDRHAFLITLGRDSNTQTWAQHIMSDAELRMHASPEAFANRDALAAMCTADMLTPKLVKPATDKTVEQWCLDAAIGLGVNLQDPVYWARFERELKVVKQLGFEDYFLIIADLVRFAKTKMFVGPARGSSCGSLICYLMGITTVDPIEHDLLFERFLDPGRADLPDIDIDFSHQRRDMVFTYLSDTYGRDHVARLGTISFMRERQLAKEVSSALKVPHFKFESVINNVEKNEGNTTLMMALQNTQDGAKLMREHPELEIIGRIEGHPRHHSTHAAGVVVTDLPVHEYVAVDARSNTAEVDKKDAEDLGLLKIDALGLKQLSIFEDCLELIGKPFTWLQKLPLNDQAAFKVLNDKLFSGVFQYNGRAVQQVSSSFNIEQFEDMVATTALARPGPLGAGGTDKWIAVRRGEATAAIEHPAFEPILARTKGIVLYQEQVMQAGREIGDMDWVRVTKLRKAVQYFGGSKGMEEFRDEFMIGAKAKEIPEDVATRFWDDLLTYGSYAFNRSHAVAYSMISYWCCYLKAHHSLEYAAALLNHEADPSRQRMQLREMEAEGVKYVPVDPETSGLKWQVTKNGLVGPISLVKGMGARTAQEYIRARDRGVDPPKRAMTLLKDPVTPLDSLTPITRSISNNHPDLTAINIFSAPTKVDELGDRAQRDLLLLLRLVKAKPRKDDKTGGTKMTALMEDDTGEIKVFFNGRKYNEYGAAMLDRGRVGTTLWAVKGSQPDGGGIIFCDAIRYLGEFKQ